MKALAKTLILVSTLSVFAGGAIAKQSENLYCATTKCSFPEQLGELQTKEFRGRCTGATMTQTNSKQTCYAVTGTTCTATAWGYTKDPYWTCSCTNWMPDHKTVSVGLHCPASE